MRGAWVEVGECGLAHPELLMRCGHDAARTSGLAMGLGLDRLLMLRKGIDDIRLLRSTDPRVAPQLLDLAPYRPVSSQPPTVRDLSVVVDEELAPEELGDAVRAALGEHATAVEEVEVRAATLYDALPDGVRDRLGMSPGQKNLLIRVVLRDLQHTLRSEEANQLRDAIYAAIHRGSRWEWAASARRAATERGGAAIQGRRTGGEEERP